MSAAGKGGFGGPQIGGGPAPIQQPSQPDIYTRLGGQQNVDSDPNTAGYQPPTASPMQPPQVQPAPTPGMGGGKSGPPSLGGMGGKGGFPGPQIGGGPAPLDPNAPSALGPQGQQPVTPQPPGGSPGFGGKSGMAISPELRQQIIDQSYKGPGTIQPEPFNPTATLF